MIALARALWLFWDENGAPVFLFRLSGQGRPMACPDALGRGSAQGVAGLVEPVQVFG